MQISNRKFLKVKGEKIMSNAVAKNGVRYITVTAMLSAIAYVLMFIDFPIPFLIPSFIQMDISELPALVGAFSMGPMCGVLICLVKNLLHLFITSTGGVGELSNFLLGVMFVLPAGLIYSRKKNKKNAVKGLSVHQISYLYQLLSFE